ncbi:hypothetical protein [Endozoicomonas sp. ONNA2]|uniref:hypothetical protein n=1 Tax=Endozoicomonas sp. ONNA2 TaxID=2828741 RepID=UPI0021475C21|nr:hypothetical protein [Endozoicomonas sp. ONNA2]
MHACPGASHDLPQGNLGDELKALLQSFAECMDKQQPLPVSDCKPFVKYFGEYQPMPTLMSLILKITFQQLKKSLLSSNKFPGKS